jgi:PAS domain S-box-containing protein
MSKKTLSPFFVAFLLFIAVIIIYKISFRNMREYTNSVDHSRVVITSFERLSNYIKSSEVYSVKYASKSEKSFYGLYKIESDKIRPQILMIKSLVKDNPKQELRIDTLQYLIESQLPTLLQKNLSEIIESGEVWRLDTLLEIHNTINRAVELELVLLGQRSLQRNKTTRYTNVLTIIFSVLAITLIAATFFFNLYLVRKRKWLEGFLESILNTSRNGIVTYKAVREKDRIVDFKIEFANTASAELLGVNTEDMLGKKLSEITLYVRDPDLLEKYIKVVETGTKHEFETLYNVGDKQLWLYVLLAKMEDGVTVSFNNITEIKKHQDELQNNIKWLAESNKELEQYAYVASHDLQEPLRKIMVYGNILNTQHADKLNEKGAFLLKKIGQSAERMSALIYGILNFSAVKRETEFTSTDLNTILSSVLEDLELKIEQSGAIIHNGTLPVVEAIPLQMTQLFHNLISNALKFTKEGIAPVISITSNELTTEEVDQYPQLNKGIKHYCIVFADNGIGFNQQYVDQIFGMFKRLNDKDIFPGSGIGLALCRKVIIIHNGIIVAKGSEGGGASFSVILPEKQLLINN